MSSARERGPWLGIVARNLVWLGKSLAGAKASIFEEFQLAFLVLFSQKLWWLGGY
jgi:hypothetical protein